MDNKSKEQWDKLDVMNHLWYDLDWLNKTGVHKDIEAAVGKEFSTFDIPKIYKIVYSYVTGNKHPEIE